MLLKIKVQPEDFIVEESALLPLTRRGDFVVYCLKKRGRNTFDILREIAQKYNLSMRDIAYGGKKDRQGNQFQVVVRKLEETQAKKAVQEEEKERK